MTDLQWIAADWGTSRLRLWAIGDTGEVLDKITSDLGMARLASDQFEDTLINLISNWLSSGREPVPVVACGMVGARQGWMEVAYTETPCILRSVLKPVKTKDPRISVYICGGLKQMSPADVMRGEETQLVGWSRELDRSAGVLCLPGTHSKWARIESSQILNFQSFMTGELYELLSKQSVLRFSMDDSDWNERVFLESIEAANESPGSISAKLFQLRASGLVAAEPSRGSVARLSGYLIGLELNGAKEFWSEGPVSIIGTTALAKHYQTALAYLEQESTLLDAETLTLAGLRAAFEQI